LARLALVDRLVAYPGTVTIAAEINF